MLLLSKTLVAGAAFLLIAAAAAAFPAGEGWETDLDTALAKAKEAHKPVLADFSGSDWCGWCIKLEDEVFSQEEFKAFARDNLVPCVIDFPKDQSKLAAGQLEKNQDYRSRYTVQGYPTVFLLEPDGSIFLQTGYRPGGAASYVDHLRLYVDGRSRVQEFLAREGTDLSAAKALIESLPEDAAALRAEVVWASFPAEMVAERASAVYNLIKANKDKDGKLAEYLKEVAEQDPGKHWDKLQQDLAEKKIQAARDKLNSLVQSLLAAREENAPAEVKAKAAEHAKNLLAAAEEALAVFKEPQRRQMVFVFQAVAHNTLGDQAAADAAWKQAVEIDPNAQILKAAKEMVNPTETKESPAK